jgi:hypothetical protein
MMKITTMLITIFLFSSTILTGCSVGKAKPPVVFVIGIDITTSIPADQFKNMKQMAAEMVISRIRHRDEVHILKIDTDPQDEVKYFSVEGGRVGLSNEAKQIYEYIMSVEQPKGYQGTTNIAGVLAHVKRAYEEDQKARNRLQDTGRPVPPAPIYFGLIFSDGKLEGKQSIVEGKWPEEVKIWFWGIDLKYEHLIENLCHNYHIPQGNMQIVPFTHWESRAKTFGLEFDRQPNIALLETILDDKPHVRKF